MNLSADTYSYTVRVVLDYTSYLKSKRAELRFMHLFKSVALVLRSAAILVYLVSRQR